MQAKRVEYSNTCRLKVVKTYKTYKLKVEYSIYREVNR
jgi:hypothetical protein